MLIHSKQHDLHDALEAESHAHGFMGGKSLPSTVHAADISDTGLVRCIDAHAAGLAKRDDRRKATAAYMAWLANSRDNLGDAIEAAMAQGCTDVGEWLKARFTSETGVAL